MSAMAGRPSVGAFSLMMASASAFPTGWAGDRPLDSRGLRLEPFLPGLVHARFLRLQIAPGLHGSLLVGQILAFERERAFLGRWMGFGPGGLVGEQPQLEVVFVLMVTTESLHDQSVVPWLEDA
jgi:hypothetical protein